MVVSKINKTLSYPEIRSIFPADKKLEVDLYSIVVKGIDIVVAIGNASHTYISKNIVFHPVYMIKNNSKAIQIGLYEINSNDTLSLTDTSGSLMIDKVGEPLIYTFATKKMINDVRMIPPGLNDSKNDGQSHQDTIIDNTNDITPTSIPTIRADIFTFDASTMVTTRTINTPTEETKAIAEKIKSTFEKPSSGHTAGWLQTEMHNNYYETIENDGKNDSMFMTIRDAFLQIGQSTTVLKLRQKLAAEATQETFDKYLEQYKMSSETLLLETKQAKSLHSNYTKHETMIKSTISASEQQTLIVSAKQIADQHKAAISKAKSAREMLHDFKFMKGVTTLDALKNKIQSPDYPADDWAISTLERILNIKLIIISSDYVKKDANNMMQCGNTIDNLIKSRGSFTPEFYILIESTADMHYRLISYKKKLLFIFSELPYDIKQLIVTKCIERNSGTFTLINDFRQMTIGRIGNANSKQDDIDRDIIDTVDVDVLAAVDPHVVFQFYIQSADKSAGRGTGEKIDAIGRKLDFTQLSSKGHFPNWRRKLDDTWTHIDTPFQLDDYNWNSVEHYVQAGKFKNENPKFYLEFTAESQSKLANDLNKAIAAGTEKTNPKVPSTNVSVDSSYTEKRETDDRVAAINAKFTQIPEFKNILIATKNAMIYKYIPGKKPKVATSLILVRKNIT